MTDTKHRQAALDRIVEEYDEKAAERENLIAYRFMSIERDVVTAGTYLKGHKSIRGACNYLARVIEEGERFVPVSIVDLDEGTTHELDLHAFVAPRSLGAVALLLPRAVAVGLAAAAAGDHTMSVDVAKFIEQALQGKGV